MELSDDRKGIMSTESTSSNGTLAVLKLFVVLVIFSISLAVVALVVSFISLIRTNTSDNISVTEENGSIPNQERIWSIAIGHYQNNIAYIDETSGTLKGFHIDMINAVCRTANKNCRIVYDIWQRCWDSEPGQVPRGGVGLMSGWYDACAGWIKSHSRARTFQFSKPWQKPPTYYLIVKDGNPGNINSKDVTGKIIGFVDGFINDEFCLARQKDIIGSTLSASQIRHYALPSDLDEALLSGEVDAGLKVEHNLASGLTVLEDTAMDCSMDATGGALMLRMDNDLTDWWDPALESLLQTSEYHEICRNMNDEHGHMPGREPEERCFGM